MKVVGYAYPWDVADPGFLDRVSDVGVDEVAVAVSYHSTRAATPWSATSTAVTAPHAALYRPVRSQAWDGLRLRASEAAWMRDPDSASTAITTLREAGVPTAAWVVLTHSSLLGSAHPDVAVRNCFEETYPWALCPSHPEVRAYAATLAAESVRGLDVDTVVLEACGQLGVVHQCRHEKTDGVWSPALVQLLSVCCCQRCAAGWAALPETVTRRLRETALRLLAEPDLTATETGLPTDLLGELLASRHSGTDALREEVLDALGTTATGRPTVALHGSLDPWATGALPGLTQAAGKQADTVVLPSWQPGEASLAATREARARLPAETAVGSYVTGVAGQPLADPAGDVRALRRTGSTELHLYHLGLASPARWPDLCSATAAAHDA